MGCKVVISKKANKYLDKLSIFAPKEHLKIDYFISNVLKNSKNPCFLPNAKHLRGYSDNRYRWRLGQYRIIGLVKNNEFIIIEIIAIEKRNDATYSHTKD